MPVGETRSRSTSVSGVGALTEPFARGPSANADTDTDRERTCRQERGRRGDAASGMSGGAARNEVPEDPANEGEIVSMMTPQLPGDRWGSPVKEQSVPAAVEFQRLPKTVGGPLPITRA